MRKSLVAIMVPALGLALSACAGGGPFNRDVPNEFAVSRAAPLVIPPDYHLAPPRPGAPRPLDIDAQTQALRALFPDATRLPSPAEQKLIDESGATPDATIGARSTAGDPETKIVNKGAFTADIVNAPATEGGDVASVTTGG